MDDEELFREIGFGGDASVKTVTICRNGNVRDRRELRIVSEWDWEDFLLAAAQRLRMPRPITRVFTADGLDIARDLGLIQDRDFLVVSSGDAFSLRAPRPSETASPGSAAATKPSDGAATSPARRRVSSLASTTSAGTSPRGPLPPSSPGLPTRPSLAGHSEDGSGSNPREVASRSARRESKMGSRAADVDVDVDVDLEQLLRRDAGVVDGSGTHDEPDALPPRSTSVASVGSHADDRLGGGGGGVGGAGDGGLGRSTSRARSGSRARMTAGRRAGSRLRSRSRMSPHWEEEDAAGRRHRRGGRDSEDEHGAEQGGHDGDEEDEDVLEGGADARELASSILGRLPREAPFGSDALGVSRGGVGRAVPSSRQGHGLGAADAEAVSPTTQARRRASEDWSDRTMTRARSSSDLSKAPAVRRLETTAAGPSSGTSRPVVAESGSSEAPPPVEFVGGYRVGRVLGRGGFGCVRHGRHEVTGEEVALKFLPTRLARNATEAERLTSEMRFMVELHHPNIIGLRNVFSVHGRSDPQIASLDEDGASPVATPPPLPATESYVVLILELADAGDLKAYVRSQPGGRLREEDAAARFRQVLEAVSYAHGKGLVHRDLKLENVLCTSRGACKVTDFGLSGFYRPGQTFRIKSGSLFYLAPEVFRGEEVEGPPVDVWALGVTLYAMLVGRLPFLPNPTALSQAEAEQSVRRRILRGEYDVPPFLSPASVALLRRMLHQDPAQRPTVAELLRRVPWSLVRSLETVGGDSGSSRRDGGGRSSEAKSEKKEAEGARSTTKGTEAVVREDAGKETGASVEGREEAGPRERAGSAASGGIIDGGDWVPPTLSHAALQVGPGLASPTRGTPGTDSSRGTTPVPVTTPSAAPAPLGLGGGSVLLRPPSLATLLSHPPGGDNLRGSARPHVPHLPRTSLGSEGAGGGDGSGGGGSGSGTGGSALATHASVATSLTATATSAPSPSSRGVGGVSDDVSFRVGSSLSTGAPKPPQATSPAGPHSPTISPSRPAGPRPAMPSARRVPSAAALLASVGSGSGDKAGVGGASAVADGSAHDAGADDAALMSARGGGRGGAAGAGTGRVSPRAPHNVPAKVVHGPIQPPKKTEDALAELDRALLSVGSLPLSARRAHAAAVGSAIVGSERGHGLERARGADRSHAGGEGGGERGHAGPGHSDAGSTFTSALLASAHRSGLSLPVGAAAVAPIAEVGSVGPKARGAVVDVAPAVGTHPAAGLVRSAAAASASASAAAPASTSAQGAGLPENHRVGLGAAHAHGVGAGALAHAGGGSHGIASPRDGSPRRGRALTHAGRSVLSGSPPSAAVGLQVGGTGLGMAPRPHPG